MSQRYDVQPDVYCRQLALPTPISVSTKDGVLADVFQTIVAVAMNPSIALPTPFTNKYRKQLLSGALVASVSLTVLLAAFTLFRLYRK